MIQCYLEDIWAGRGFKPAIRYRWLSYQAISPYAGLAVVAAEDQRFPEHRGFDFLAIRQALRERAEGKSRRGASTISQQVVKNLYLWPDRSWLRKGLEAWFTLLLELSWPKQRILEVYLNIIQVDERTFGMEAASQRFFKKSARHISEQEAALLAAVLPKPLSYRVQAPSVYVRERQGWILKQMRQLGGVNYLKRL
jgi:monofunctional biosynthetic peptidoglycan transglycosylase